MAHWVSETFHQTRVFSLTHWVSETFHQTLECFLEPPDGSLGQRNISPDEEYFSEFPAGSLG